MGLVATYPMQGMQPSRLREDASRSGVALPWGGPTDVGSEYTQGLSLTLDGGASQPEIWTITPSSTGTAVLMYTAGGLVYSSLPFNVATVTAAQFRAAIVPAIWPAWMIPVGSVTGGTGGPFTVTFAAPAANQFYRVGGKITFVYTGSAAVAFSRAQRGSVGTAQYDVTDDSSFLTCNAFLVDTVGLGPTGDLATTPYGPVSDSTFSPWAWTEGWFYAADSPNLTNTTMAASGTKATFFLGSTVSQPGAQVRLLQ